METDAAPTVRIWVDADACPSEIREIIFRAARRLSIETILVANGKIRVPKSAFIRAIAVPHGADVADDKIMEMLAPGDIVVTGDIPLASRVVAESAIAIGTRGELYDDSSVHERLAARDLMEQFRSAGISTRGPQPLNSKDVQAFANVLDRTLTRLRRE